MRYGYLDLAREVLRETNISMSHTEIWRSAVDTGKTATIGSTGKTPWQTLGAQIYVDIKENANTSFVQISKRPARFGLKEIAYPNDYAVCSPTQLDSNDVELERNRSFHERMLHPLLATYLYSSPYFKCYSRTIFHEKSKSKRKGLNSWLHPDMVGIYFPFDTFQGNTLKLLESLKENPYRLYSFEIKKNLDLNNLRAYYFQALSNSNWAHEGYLVVLNIEEESALFEELRRLNNAFGIGVIQLDVVNIEQSVILYQAKKREYLDWETIDRLTDENPDFREFINDLIEDIKVGKVKSNYDIRLNSDEMLRYVNEYIKK